MCSRSLFTFPTQVAVDSENPSGWNLQSRVLVTTTTGSVQLWEQSSLKWAREESLALTVVAELVEIPEKVASEMGYDLAEGFISRLTRQIADAQVCYASPVFIAMLNKGVFPGLPAIPR